MGGGDSVYHITDIVHETGNTGQFCRKTRKTWISCHKSLLPIFHEIKKAEPPFRDSAFYFIRVKKDFHP